MSATALKGLYWRNWQEIATALYDTWPETDLVNLTESRLLEMIASLPVFVDTAPVPNDHILESIQAYWINLSHADEDSGREDPFT